jgi:hypothetical protein
MCSTQFLINKDKNRGRFLFSFFVNLLLRALEGSFSLGLPRPVQLHLNKDTSLALNLLEFIIRLGVVPLEVISANYGTPNVWCTLWWGPCANGHFIHAGSFRPRVLLLLLQTMAFFISNTTNFSINNCLSIAVEFLDPWWNTTLTLLLRGRMRAVDHAMHH